MKRPIPQTIAFVGASAVTVAVWGVCWPKAEPPLAAPAETPRQVQRWTVMELTGRIDAVRNAGTNEARLKAAARLNEIPAAEVAEALESAPLIENRELTLAAKLLLSRWAADDGEVAANWAWQRFRSEGVWEEAFNEITASWAWHQPAKLCAWAKRVANERRLFAGDISLADAMLSDDPVLGFDMIDRIGRDLIPVAPREAFEVLQVRGGFSSNDIHLCESLQTVSAVREALLAFDHLDQMQPYQWHDEEITARGLLERWKELDPESFSSSPYVHLVPDSTPPPPPIPIPDTACGWVREFDAWNQAHPGGQPDMTAWPAAKRAAWQDLEALQTKDDTE